MAMEECFTDLSVEIIEQVMVPPCRPSPEKFVYLSNLDSQKCLRRMVHPLLLYNANKTASADPAKVVREALPKALGYYYSLAGRLRNTHNGKLQVECTDEGVLFIEATAHHHNVSVLNDFKDFKPSFKKLHFQYPPDTNIEDMRLLVVQVTRFKCGGFVIAASFHHNIFDGQGAAQFIRALGEISRGHSMPSTEPIHCRQLLKPRDPPRVEFRHEEFIEESRSYVPFPKEHEFGQTTLVINSHTIKKLKGSVMQECIGLECTSFEIVAALAWKARTKALQIPHHHTVKVFYASDARRSLKPPLSKGYYGNAFVFPCAVAAAQKVVNGSLSDVVKMMQKAKLLLNDQYLRSSIDFLEINSVPLEVYTSQLIITDWRWLGMEQADFGWGEAASVCPQWGPLPITTYLHAENGEGMKVWVCMEKTDLKLFQSEMQRLINEYV